MMSLAHGIAVVAFAVWTYFVVLGAMRIAKALVQMNPSAIVLAIVIADLVVVSPDWRDALVAASALAIVFRVLQFGVRKWAWVRCLVEGRPVKLVHNGKVLWENLRRSQICRHYLQEAMREHGVTDVTDVRLALLEPDGNISIIPRDHAKYHAHAS